MAALIRALRPLTNATLNDGAEMASQSADAHDRLSTAPTDVKSRPSRLGSEADMVTTIEPTNSCDTEAIANR